MACLFCLLAVSACNKNKKPNRNGSDVEVWTDENGVRWAEDEWGTLRVYDKLPNDLDYDGEPVSLLHWEGGLQRPEFEQTEEVDNDILSSLYKRNMAIQDRLDVEIMFNSAGEESKTTVFVQKVQAAHDSGEHDYDLLSGYAKTIGQLTVKGYNYNISAIENTHIDLSNPWWPSNITGNCAIGGNLYFITGDMSTNTIFQMHTMYINKTLVNADLQAEAVEYFKTNPHVKTAATPSRENPEGGDTATNMIYEKVYAGKWVLDDFLAYAAGKYGDKTGNGVSLDDKYGFCGIGYGMCAFYGASNLRMIEPTDDGSILKISDDWTSSKTVKLITKLNGLYSTNDFHDYRKTTGENSDYGVPFGRGNSLFFLYYMRYAMDTLVNSSRVTAYGIIPTPKWDTNQKNYYTMLGNEISLYAIFSDFDTRGDEQATLSMLSAVIECWASEAFRKTTPVIFELSLKLKASPTQCEADMCEIVRKSIEVDLGRFIRSALTDDSDDAFGMDSQVIQAALDGTPWSTVVNQNLESIRQNLADFVKTLRETMV